MTDGRKTRFAADSVGACFDGFAEFMEQYADEAGIDGRVSMQVRVAPHGGNWGIFVQAAKEGAPAVVVGGFATSMSAEIVAQMWVAMQKVKTKFDVDAGSENVH